MRAFLAPLLLVGISSSALAQPPAGDEAPGRLEVRSTAFGMNDPIPPIYTCDGANISPPLSWSKVPEGTRSVAILMDDPDAPRGTFTHWLVTGIPPATLELPSGAAIPNATLSYNDRGELGYTGPCPPSGRHRYRFRVYALDIPLRGEMSRETFLQVIDDHVLAQGMLVGVYQRDQGAVPGATPRK